MGSKFLLFSLSLLLKFVKGWSYMIEEASFLLVGYDRGEPAVSYI